MKLVTALASIAAIVSGGLAISNSVAVHEQRELGQKKQLSEEQHRERLEKKALGQEKKKPAGDPAQKPKVRKPLVLLTQEDVGRVVADRTPRLVQFEMSYHEINGLRGQSQWHIGETSWWVRLHGSVAIENLDRSKRYRVVGYAMEQNYGVVEVWLRELGSLE